jgi:hypothetical protein
MTWRAYPMNLNELDNIAKQQDSRARKYAKIFEEYPDALQIYTDDGEACTKDLEIFSYE